MLKRRVPALALVAAVILVPAIAHAVTGDRAGGLDLSFGSGGTVTTSFSADPNVTAFAAAVATQPDGKIVEVGARTAYSNGANQQDFAVVRLNTDGSLDPNFGNGGKVVTDIGTQGDVANAVAVQPDGKIVVAGQDQLVPGGNEDLVVARYEPGGELDSSFGNGGIAIVHDDGYADFAYSVGVEPDGSIVAAGNQYGTQNGANNDFLIVRLTSHGQLDPSFGSGGEVANTFQSGNANQAAYTLAVQPNGEVIVGGFSQPWSGTPPSDFALERFTTHGTLDPNFGSGGQMLTDFGADSADGDRALALQSDGKIVATGNASSGIALARYNDDGTLDTSFGNGGTEIESSSPDVTDEAGGVAVDGSGRIVVAGDGATPQRDLEVARFEPDGMPDPTFGSGGFSHVHVEQGSDFATGMALEPDGNVVVAEVGNGSFTATRFLAAPLASTYVSASGTSLRLAGQPFRPIGINIYNANSNNNCWYSMSSGSTLDDALTAIGPGANTIRAWFFQSLATSNGKRDWSAFDHTLAVARAHGMKVIATLGNQWPDCEPAAGYKNTAWYEGGYKQPDPGGTVSYRDWAQQVASRYKDDTTILAWQLLNEPEVLPSMGADCGATIGESTAEHDLQAWAQDVSGAIKGVDPNHLISLGTIGGGQCGAQGSDYKTVMSTPNLDLCEFHDYAPSQPIPGDQYNGLQVRIDECNQLDKPLLVGELGVRPNDVGGTFAARADTVTGKLCAQLTAGVAGDLLWAWDKDGSRLNDFDIGPGDPVLGALAPWTDPSHGCTPPGAPRSVVAAAGDGSASISWLRPSEDGGGSVTSYTVTASTGGATKTVTAPATTATFAGLTDGVGYTFTVTASNGAGNGGQSISRPVTPTSGTQTPVTASGTTPPGGNVSTDPNGIGPTPAAPTTTAVTVPSGGDVEIVETAASGTPPAGFQLLGQQVSISAPAASSAQPLTLTFQLDASQLGGLQPGDVQILRTEASGGPTVVADCSATDGTATPDPCVASRTPLPSGDLQTVVLTSAASVWNLAFASDRTPPTVTIGGVSPAVIGPTQSTTVNWHANENGTYSVRVGGNSCTTGTQIAAGPYGNEPSAVTTNVPGSSLAPGTNTLRICVTDAAHNTGLATSSVVEDATAPTITLATPANGASFTVGSVVKASYTCSDAGGAGLASCTGTVANGAPIATGTVGAKTFAVNAADKAANTATKTVSYLIVYPFTGFQSPVSNPPKVNQTQAGGSVPLKFTLGGNRGLNVLAGSPTSAPVNCTTLAITGAGSATTGALTYDTSAGRYTYTWQTAKTWVGTCRVFTLTLNDSTTHLAYFRFGN